MNIFTSLWQKLKAWHNRPNTFSDVPDAPDDQLSQFLREEFDDVAVREQIGKQAGKKEK